MKILRYSVYLEMIMIVFNFNSRYLLYICCLFRNNLLILNYHMMFHGNLPVNSSFVRLKLGLRVKCCTDGGISCCSGCWDVDLWGLGGLLTGACHLKKKKNS